MRLPMIVAGIAAINLALSTACSDSQYGEPPPSNDASRPADSGSTVDATVSVADVDAAEEEQKEEHGCPSLFAQDKLPEWRVTLNAGEWAALQDEFFHRLEREAAGLEINPYHPVDQITYDDGSGPVQVPEVLIRLKGDSSWVHAILYDENPKMQLVIAFNEVDPEKRFKGVRKVELDMPRSDWTYLRQRLALYTIRQVGQDAQCANNAKLYINGEYYGLYTHLERLDKEFIQRVYGNDNGVDDGDLWKNGFQIRTNEDSYSRDRLDALWGASSASELSILADLDAAVYEWAAEAILPHADGFHIGRHNFFLYDHPWRGFLWLPSDLDTAFDFHPPEIDAVFPVCVNRDYRFWIPYATTLGDPYWMGRYVDALATIRGLYDPADQVALVDTWSAQIAAAAQADPHRPFSMDDHAWALGLLRDHLYLRDGFLGDWLSCRQTGTGDDWDDDGVVFCFDCDDQHSSVHPGRAESCNGVDDDCDGFLDEGCD